MEDVLEASRASGRRSRSSSSKTAFLASKFSKMASTTRSQAARSRSSVVVVMRAREALLSSCGYLAFFDELGEALVDVAHAAIKLGPGRRRAA